MADYRAMFIVEKLDVAKLCLLFSDHFKGLDDPRLMEFKSGSEKLKTAFLSYLRFRKTWAGWDLIEPHLVGVSDFTSSESATALQIMIDVLSCQDPPAQNAAIDQFSEITKSPHGFPYTQARELAPLASLELHFLNADPAPSDYLRNIRWLDTQCRGEHLGDANTYDRDACTVAFSRMMQSKLPAWETAKTKPWFRDVTERTERFGVLHAFDLPQNFGKFTREAYGTLTNDEASAH